MYTILIVDDERPAQTFIKAICQKYCPAFDTILLSGSADDALRLMAQQHVHVLVTDISMPGINGIELAQRVRQLYPRTHTVIVSGYAEFEFARGAIQAGVDDYLLKPVEIQSFRQILDRIRETLDAEANDLMEETLTRLLCGEAVDEPLLCSQPYDALCACPTGQFVHRTLRKIPHRAASAGASGGLDCVLWAR